MTSDLPNLPDDLSDDRYREIARAHAPQAAEVARERSRPYWRDPARWGRDLAVLGLAAFALLGYFTKQSSQDDKNDLNGQVSALQQQVRDLGATPVAGPSGAHGAQGARGLPGPAPTDAQVQADIRAVCGVTPSYCQQPVSLARLRTAVSACFAAKQCPAPKPGKPGRSGASGASGAAGATGPGPTPQQIADGWASWCSSHSCVGPKGDTGERGPKGDQGEQGVGIAAIDCTGLGIDSLTVHLTDGTTQTVPCNAATPTPTPTGAPS